MEKVVIGVVHLKPLPGSPLHNSLDDVLNSAIRDAKVLEEGGVDALIIENYGDLPYLKEVGKETVACMTAVALEIRREVGVGLGINVLRNDPIAALAIAKAVKADFIRVNQSIFPSVTPEGHLESTAAELWRYKKNIDCDAMVFGDIEVKHAIHFARLEDYILNIERSLLDAVVLTGKATGMEVRLSDLKKVRETVKLPILVGSGVNSENVGEILNYCDGVIVGTYFKKRGVVDADRVRKIVRVAKGQAL
ncbi:hypothetical protein B6U96_13150 [Archaeoglobales archaeon ex4484_92]|nr:MAG: hypothetical protein B6U96_13150 [Archaeoglobales archaeon ex4484_92]